MRTPKAGHCRGKGCSEPAQAACKYLLCLHPVQATPAWLPRHSDRAQPARCESQVLPGEMGKHWESLDSTRRVNSQPREQKMRFQLLVDLLVCPQLALRTQKKMFHSKALSIFKEQKH